MFIVRVGIFEKAYGPFKSKAAATRFMNRYGGYSTPLLAPRTAVEPKKVRRIYS